ncbi:hypothetical protein [Photorhabdus khanii]|uniref:Uncharacterized protein n=1 Tax=Photorhabdus khanii subsp. guanajuatensis TaxID=2100166 RepID=A0A4R4J3Y0_9GAMM|nr:hypothetical protein [Photorhabdus khanii]TDB48224.1 hypothetical protein C5467_19310 [Photorhabdus khanii subsp. guanajuatensis]
MGNAFDFELNADENVTKVIDEINAKLNSLNPNLAKTKEGLKFGGSESTDGVDVLGTKLRDMSQYAKDNVQHIGDMVPPLKNVGELATKYAGIGAKIGGIGMVAYGATKAFKTLNEGASNAYNLDVSAKNAAMTPENFSRLRGAMIILGAEADKAHQAVESLYEVFNEPLQTRNVAKLAQLNSMGVHIYTNKDGTADAYKTIQELAKVFPEYSSDKQKTIAKLLGLDDNTLALLRDAVGLKERLKQSDRFGFTIDPELNNRLNELNSSLRELNASWEGFKQRGENNLNNLLTFDGSVKDGIEGVTDILTNGLDSISLAHALGATRGKEADQLRWGYNTPEFYQSLSWSDKVALDFGVMSDGFREKYNEWQKTHPQNEAIPQPQKIPEPQKIEPPKYPDPYAKPVKDSFGLRNNNPGNVRDAPNGIGYVQGKSGTFVKFDNSHDGLSAMARQLMLNGDRGKNTVNSTISTYSPPGGIDRNNTQAYINFVSKETGFLPNQQLDMHAPKVLGNLMEAMIKQENHGQQPFNQKQIADAINAAIFDPRWQGKRDINYLQLQRLQYQPAPPESDKRSASIFANQANNSELAQGVVDAIQTAIGENKFQVEITLVNSKTGERQQFNAKTGGRVTTSMQYP